MDGNAFQSLGKQVKREYWKDCLEFKHEYFKLKVLADAYTRGGGL